MKVGEQMPEESKISKAQQKAVNKYVKNNYDRINVTFPNGIPEDVIWEPCEKECNNGIFFEEAEE